MLSARFSLEQFAEPLVLGLSAHPDDLEIGAGGTLLRLLDEQPRARLLSVVLTSDDLRAAEAAAAVDVMAGGRGELVVHRLRDGYLPEQWGSAKDLLREATTGRRPTLVLAPSRDDAHQDHRVVSELARQLFRDTLVLEYEVPKWDGDLGRPDTYVSLPDHVVDRKVALIRDCYGSQAGRPWFDDEVFRGLLRLRGVECGARYAEAFTARKILLQL